MPRKLIFAAGLLHCFFCHLDPAADQAKQLLKAPGKDISALTEYMERQLLLTPLELVAQACLQRGIKSETAHSIFDNYDRFLSILDDPTKRSELGAKSHEGLRNSAVWNEIRKISQPFHRGLVDLFLNDDNELKDLTMEYGVF
jgi:hypothetical protein